MTLAETLNRIVEPQAGANALRWSGEAGHYEAWYATLNDPASRIGLWLRYTVDAPLGERAPYCELWAHAFFPSDPLRSFGVRDRFPITDLVPRGDELSIAGARLAPARLSGAAGLDGHRILWDLGFEPSPTAVHLAPWPMRASGLASTSVVFANEDVRFTGTVTLDGHVLRLNRAPGQQAHLWGRKHAAQWAWGHCNAFDGRDDCSVDGVTAWLKRFGRKRGPVTGVYLRYGGRDYLLNTLGRMLRVRSDVRFPAWRFEGTAGGLTFVGIFRAPTNRMVQVSYEDPDGEISFCANTEIGDLTLDVYERGHLLDTLVATETAHLEFGDRRPRPEVRATV